MKLIFQEKKYKKTSNFQVSDIYFLNNSLFIIAHTVQCQPGLNEVEREITSVPNNTR